MPGVSRGVRRKRQAQAKARRKAAKAKRCGCGKLAYRNEWEAVEAQTASGVGCRIYRCDAGAWHLTGQAKRFR